MPKVAIGEAIHVTATALYADCHMMVSRPEQWVGDIADAGAEQFTFHFEATGGCFMVKQASGRWAVRD